MSYTILSNEIIGDINLKYDEKMLFIGLTRYFNKSMGYAFPKYEQLMEIMGTKRREKISTTLEKLVKKGYILIEKIGRKNRYFILKHYDVKQDQPIVEDQPIIEEEPTPIVEEPTPIEVDQPMIIEEDKPIIDHVDSNGKKPLDGQMDIEHYISFDAMTYTNEDKIELVKSKIKSITVDQMEVLKKYNYNEIRDVLNSAENVNFNYLLRGLEMQDNKKTKFNNFRGRDYNYDQLERYLLGWDEIPEYTFIPQNGGNYTSNNSRLFA